ncbi:MAG: flagellar biosynthetic protein FliO [Lachnospira sp.]|nr:flagellar biosynthetic protein FliO [Lachnospira sp.]
MMLLSVSSSRIEAFVQLITLVIIFALVLAMTYFATRFVGNYKKEKMAGSNISVLETFRLSNSKYIQIIKMGSKFLAIAICKDSVTVLCELQESDLEFTEVSTQIKSENFKAVLDKFRKDKPKS